MDLWTMCLQGSAMIVAVVLARILLFRRLPKSAFVFLWCLVLVRLLVPFSLVVPFNAWSLMDPGLVTPAAEVQTALVEPALDGGLPAGDPAASAVAAFEGARGVSDAWVAEDAASREGRLAQVLGWHEVLRAIWPLGCVVAAVVFALMYRCGLVEYSCSLPVESDYANEWLAYHKIDRPLQIRQHDRIVSPMTYGLFKPVILVPSTFDWSDRGGARIVLEHEFTHIVRWDAVRKALLVVAVCLYWFDPLVWLMFVLANRDIELACDEQVARALTPKGRAAYARALVDLAELHSLVPLASHFGQNAVEERVLAIRNVRDMGVLVVLVTVLLALGVSSSFATTPMSAEEFENWATVNGFTIGGSGAEVDKDAYVELAELAQAPTSGKLVPAGQNVRDMHMAGARVIATPHYALTLFDSVAGGAVSWEYRAEKTTAEVGGVQVELYDFLTVRFEDGPHAGQGFVAYCMNLPSEPLILDGVSLLGPNYVEASLGTVIPSNRSLRVRVAVPVEEAERFDVGAGSVAGPSSRQAAAYWTGFVSHTADYPVSERVEGGVRVYCPGYSVFVSDEELAAGYTWKYSNGTSADKTSVLRVYASSAARLANDAVVQCALVTEGFYAVNETNSSVSIAAAGAAPEPGQGIYAVLAYASDHESPQAAEQAVATWLPRFALEP